MRRVSALPREVFSPASSEVRTPIAHGEQHDPPDDEIERDGKARVTAYASSSSTSVPQKSFGWRNNTSAVGAIWARPARARGRLAPQPVARRLVSGTS